MVLVGSFLTISLFGVDFKPIIHSGSSQQNSQKRDNSTYKTYSLPEQKSWEILKLTPLYSQLEPLIKKGKIKIKGIKEGGFYILRLITPRGLGNVYITADKKYTIVGAIVNNKTKQPLQGHFPVNQKVVKEGVLFSFGSGKRDLYLVTDPECPYCRIMEKKTKDTLKKEYRVHVILFPLPFHRHARQMSYYILAAKTDSERAQRLQKILQGSDEWKNFNPTSKQLEQFEKELKKSQEAVVELGARGTPSVYDDHFQMINWVTLIPHSDQK